MNAVLHVKWEQEVEETHSLILRKRIKSKKKTVREDDDNLKKYS
jgi:hypothetical protein